MSVLIEGMEMPTSGELLVIITPNGEVKYKKSVASMWDRTTVVNVPEPHGRLIDADALNYTMLYRENWMRGTGVEAPAVWRKDIDAAPTIIPANDEPPKMVDE